jgi:hypothetical protein
MLMRSQFAALAISLLLPGFASAALRGDWQSAGGPMQPYYPAYKFLYACQAELTDHQERVGDGEAVPAGRPYQLYAVKKFEVAAKKTYTDLSGEWQWVAKILDAQDRSSMYLDLKAPPKGAFSTEGHGASIGFQRGETPAADIVTLSAYVKLPLGDYYLSQHNRETVSRASTGVEVRASAYLTRESGQPESLPRSKQRELFVICDKKK